MAIDGSFANTSATKFTIAAAGRAALSVSSALTPVPVAGVGGWTGKFCHVAQTLKGRERDLGSSSHWVKYAFSTLVKTNI